MKAKYIPNILSFSRIPLSVAMFLFAWWDNMTGFLACFIASGLSDVFDGIIARKLNAQSELGEKLDSIGDGVYLVTAILVVIFATDIVIPAYCFAIFAVLMASRIVNMVYTWKKFRRVGFIHTRFSRWASIPMFAMLLIVISWPEPLSIGVPLAIFLTLTTIAQCEETIILRAMQPEEYTMSLKSYRQWKRDRDLSIATEPAEQQEVTV